MSNKKSPQKSTPSQDASPVEEVKVTKKDETPSETPQEVTQDVSAEKVNDESPKEEKRPSDAYGASWTDAQKAHFDSQQWTTNETKRFEAAVKDPAKAYIGDSDVLVFDPKREKRPVTHWSTEELTEYLKGNLSHVASHWRDGVADEYRRRVSVDPAWSNDDLHHYLRSGEEPKKTASGVWLRDVTRDKRPVSEWTTEELKAWAFGEIHTKVESHRLLAEINQRLDLSIPTQTTDMRRIRQLIEADQTRIQDTAKRIEQGKLTHMNATHIDTVLDQYIAAVKPGQEVTPSTAAQAQNSLERLFVYVINLDGQAMAEGLNKIKAKVVQERKGVFSPSNAHRFTEYVKGDGVVKLRHIALLEMFMIVADPNKARRKQTDVKSMLKDFPADKRDRLADYFTNYA